MNKMYIVVNQDLKMGKGLVSAQVAHAVFDFMDCMIKQCLAKEYPDDVEAELFDLSYNIDYFRNNGNGMIILQAPEEQLLEFQKEGYVTVIDRLMDNKVTAVNLGSFNDENKPDFIKELKLLGR